MKLSMVRVANAVHCGPKTDTVFALPEYDIEVHDEIKIKITHKRTNAVIWTSFFNVIYWTELSDVAAEQVAGITATRRGRPAKAEAQA